MNVATCLTCGEVLVSAHRHDFRTCGCPAALRVRVDGGNDYIVRMGGSEARWTDSPDGTGAVQPHIESRVEAPRLFGEDMED